MNNCIRNSEATSVKNLKRCGESPVFMRVPRPLLRGYPSRSVISCSRIQSIAPSYLTLTYDRKQMITNNIMAERVGFEPTLPFRVNTLSKRAPSATRPSLRRSLGVPRSGRLYLPAGARLRRRSLVSFYGLERDSANSEEGEETGE